MAGSFLICAFNLPNLASIRVVHSQVKGVRVRVGAITTKEDKLPPPTTTTPTLRPFGLTLHCTVLQRFKCLCPPRLTDSGINLLNNTIRTSEADLGMPRQTGAYIQAFYIKNKQKQDSYMLTLQLKIYFGSEINKDNRSKINACQI